MKIIIKSLFKSNRLTKKSNANNIFQVMHKKQKENPENKSFVFDMTSVDFVATIVFAEIKRLMQINFDGNFELRLENSKQIIKATFDQAFN